MWAVLLVSSFLLCILNMLCWERYQCAGLISVVLRLSLMACACLVQSQSEEEEESELEVAHTLLGLAEWKVSNAMLPVLTRTSH